MLEVAARDLVGLAAGEADDEDVLAAVADEADAVELVEDAPEAAGSALALVLFLVGLVADARRECDASRVRRPRDRLDGLLQLGELQALAAPGRDHVEVRRRLVVATAVRREREPFAIWRPARCGVAALA